jgi:hypothetical protein
LQIGFKVLTKKSAKPKTPDLTGVLNSKIGFFLQKKSRIPSLVQEIGGKEVRPWI